MFKGKLEVIPEIAGLTVMVMLGTLVLTQALRSNGAQSLARIPGVGSIVAGLQAARDAAYN